MRSPHAHSWAAHAVQIIEADFNRSSDTHLLRVPLPGVRGVALYLKDESTHPTGSLKHRLARSLFLYSLCNGWIGPQTTIVEASSGSTAVSEAYFAGLLGLRFVAVIPRTTSSEKIEQRATDWHGNNNIAESIFSQMEREDYPIPSWVVVGAGTGGTSATVGRYIRYRRLPTQLCLADPEASVFHRHVADRNVRDYSGPPSVIEGIGRPRCEPSFLPTLIDRAYAVPDVASIAAARVLSRRIGRSCGGSTGTNLWAAAQIVAEMEACSELGSIVTLLCDSKDRYRSTYLDAAWLQQRGIDTGPSEATMDRFFETGVFAPPGCARA